MKTKKKIDHGIDNMFAAVGINEEDFKKKKDFLIKLSDNDGEGRLTSEILEAIVEEADDVMDAVVLSYLFARARTKQKMSGLMGELASFAGKF